MSSARDHGVAVVPALLLFFLAPSSLPAQRAAVPSGGACPSVAAESYAASQASPPQVIPALPVPRLIKFGGIINDAAGQPRSGLLGLTFAIYSDPQGGSALWMESQNAELDANGHYTVLLGSTQSEGVPLKLFSTGEPRWLGAQVQLPGEPEQPRVLMVSVPYALKASDAETLGGRPASAYLTAEQFTTGSGSHPATTAGGVATNASGTGTPNTLPKWLDTAGTLVDSAVSESGGVVQAPAYGFSANLTPPTTPVATIFNQAFVGPVFSGLSFRVRTGTTPTDALVVDQNQNLSVAQNASALAYTFTGNATPPTTATATILNQAFVGPVFSGLSFRVRTGATPTDALTVDPNQNVGIGTTTPSQRLEVAGTMKVGGNGVIFPDGSQLASANTVTGALSVSGGVQLTGPGSGIIVKSPNGTKCALIGIDNSGNLTSTAVACP